MIFTRIARCYVCDHEATKLRSGIPYCAGCCPPDAVTLRCTGRPAESNADVLICDGHCPVCGCNPRFLPGSCKC